MHGDQGIKDRHVDFLFPNDGDDVRHERLVELYLGGAARHLDRHFQAASDKHVLANLLFVDVEAYANRRDTAVDFVARVLAVVIPNP